MNSNVEDSSPRPRQWQADALLLVVTLIWGYTFILVKQSVATFPVYAFLCMRFTLAALVLLALFGRRLRSLNGNMIGAGVAIGVFLFAGYVFQTFGLQYTSASKAAFITGLSVVIVPLLSAVLVKQVPPRWVSFGVALSTAGLAFLTLARNPSSGYTLVPFVWQRGDLIVLGCAACFALHIVAVSLFAPRTDALALTAVQVLVVALLSGVASLACERRPTEVSAGIWQAAAFTGLLATAAAFAVQNSVQTWTTATHTALIFVAEPVFATLLGYLLAGERLTQQALVGCSLILMGMLLAELQPSTHVRRSHVLEGKESTR